MGGMRKTRRKPPAYMKPEMFELLMESEEMATADEIQKELTGMMQARGAYLLDFRKRVKEVPRGAISLTLSIKTMMELVELCEEFNMARGLVVDLLVDVSYKGLKRARKNREETQKDMDKEVEDDDDGDEE